MRSRGLPLQGGHGPFPQVLVMALAECGTRAVVAIETGNAEDAEQPLALALARQPGNLEPGMLVMADRGIYSYRLLTVALDYRHGLLDGIVFAAHVAMLGDFLDGVTR